MLLLPTILTLISVGCVPTYESGNHLVEINHNGENRQFQLFVPTGLQPIIKHPTVFGIHGIRSSPEWYRGKSKLEEAMQEKKWLGVFPFGSSPDNRTGENKCCSTNGNERNCALGPTPNETCSWNAGSCCGFSESQNISDVDFLKFVAHWMTTEMCADSDAIFATGFSNGGMMTNRLGCEAADVFLAIAPVAGNLELPNCKPVKPISWISFCGGMDGVCVSTFDKTVRYWAAVNNCTSPRVSWESETATCSEYSCPNGIFVEYCFIPTLRHVYPGLSTAITTDPNATKMIFDRFSLAMQNKKLYSPQGDSAGLPSSAFVPLFISILLFLL